MGRATVYGKEVVTLNREFLAVNLGYNFYREHEGDTKNFVCSLNTDMETKFRLAFKSKLSREVRQYNKQLKKNILTAKKYGQYEPYMLYSNVPYFKREIIIDNSDIRHKYTTFQTRDGNYTLLVLGDTRIRDNWVNKYGNRRKFNESEILYMPDYQSYSLRNNLGRMNNKASYIGGDKPFVGVWATESPYLMLLISREYDKDEIVVNGIISALGRGSLAVLPQSSCTKDRGCILIDMDKYLIRC